MSKLLFAALLVVSAGPAGAQEWVDTPAVGMQAFCHAALHPEDQPPADEKTDGLGDPCVFTVSDYLIDRRLLAADAPDSIAIPLVTCGIQLVLNHPADMKSVKDILDAEFDKACEPATM